MTKLSFGIWSVRSTITINCKKMRIFSAYTDYITRGSYSDQYSACECIWNSLTLAKSTVVFINYTTTLANNYLQASRLWSQDECSALKLHTGYYDWLYIPWLNTQVMACYSACVMHPQEVKVPWNMNIICHQRLQYWNCVILCNDTSCKCVPFGMGISRLCSGNT